MFLTLAIIVAVVIAALLVYAATKPDTFRIQRTATIKAPPDKVFALINDLQSHLSWSPFEKDPAIKRRFNGTTAGKGAVYEWEGNRKVGKGRIEIADTTPPSRITMKLDMVKPFQAHNTVDFTIAPEGEATNVTWAMQGAQPFMAKLVGTFMNCDKMVGGEFEQGLAKLKLIAEQ